MNNSLDVAPDRSSVSSSINKLCYLVPVWYIIRGTAESRV
jgi:hypothetical protein